MLVSGDHKAMDNVSRRLGMLNENAAARKDETHPSTARSSPPNSLFGFRQCPRLPKNSLFFCAGNFADETRHSGTFSLYGQA
jgi:hypothetical protein